MTDEIRAIGTRRNNAELMADCAALGYFPGTVLDVTYGEGRFWRTFRPHRHRFLTNDIDPDTGAEFHHDFTDLPFADRSFVTVVFDPPYKLNGTGDRGGPATSDNGYGVGGTYKSVRAKHRLIRAGITECARVASRYLLIKCMDQVNAGAVVWQTRIFANTAERHGAHLVDMLHVPGYRKQPEGRSQEHARRDYSTLLVCEIR